MWKTMPDFLQRLLGRGYRYPLPVSHPYEWSLYRMAMYQLGLNLQTAYQIMDGGPLPRRFRYRHFSIAKKDGTPREIVQPGHDLMIVQRKILKLYLNRLKPHPAALGFRRKKSIADHAWAHAGSAILISADIQDFFPSTSRQRIKGWWRQQGYSTLETRLLTSLTTYRGALPQGAPTSPALSNLVNAELDAALDRRVKQSGGLYTRYADDMVFSWPDGYAPPADFEQAVRAILHESGYQLHPRKGWHVWNRREEPKITGVVLTKRGQVELPESMRRLMRALSQSKDITDRARLAGYEGYEAMIKRAPRQAGDRNSPAVQSSRSRP